MCWEFEKVAIQDCLFVSPIPVYLSFTHLVKGQCPQLHQAAAAYKVELQLQLNEEEICSRGKKPS